MHVHVHASAMVKINVISSLSLRLHKLTIIFLLYMRLLLTSPGPASDNKMPIPLPQAKPPFEISPSLVSVMSPSFPFAIPLVSAQFYTPHQLILMALFAHLHFYFVVCWFNFDLVVKTDISLNCLFASSIIIYIAFLTCIHYVLRLPCILHIFKCSKVQLVRAKLPFHH